MRGVPLRTRRGSTARPWHGWALNSRLGWPERARGLHYWLGYEYALALPRLGVAEGARLLDVGTGAHSVLPYLAAVLRGVKVTVLDIAPAVVRQ